MKIFVSGRIHKILRHKALLFRRTQAHPEKIRMRLAHSPLQFAHFNQVQLTERRAEMCRRCSIRENDVVALSAKALATPGAPP